MRFARLRLRTGVHRYAVRVLDQLGHAPLRADLHGHPVRSLAVGVDPIRVTLIGGGLAVGYGVESRREAVDGPLAHLVSAATGRGAVIENYAVQHVPVPDVVRSLGGVGLHSCHVVVWFPSFVDGLERLRERSWKRELDTMIRGIRSEREIPLVLTRMPVPDGFHPAAVLARPWVARLNATITAAAARHHRVTVVDTEPFTPGPIGHPVTGPTYFAEVAARIVPAVVAAIASHAPALSNPRDAGADAVDGTPAFLRR